VLVPILFALAIHFRGGTPRGFAFSDTYPGPVWPCRW